MTDTNIIVSPNLIFNYMGLFTSDKEWIHPDRTEETYEIICVTRGEVYLNDAGTEYKLNKGDVLLLYPGVRHYGSKISCGVSFYWLHFKLKQGVLPLNAGLYKNMENVYLFKELLHLCNLPEKHDYAINAVLSHILALMMVTKEEGLYGADRASQEIYEWIRINANASLSAKKAAEHFGFSEDHLTRILKKSFGTGTKELIVRFTLIRAKELLCNTGKYVKEIGAELEFPSDKAFIAFFRYHTGIYPGDFRNKFIKTHMNSK